MTDKEKLLRPARASTMIVIGLCASLLSISPARAQKQPPLLKDETSATEKAYVNQLISDYRTYETSNPEKAKPIRNKLIYVGVEQIDTAFNDYRKNSRKRNDLLQFLFDFLEIGMSTTVGVINGERAKTVLGEVLTGFKGSRTAANKNFRLMEGQILFNKMVANRAKTLAAIYKNLNDDVTSYPWERARAQLRDYFLVGTIDDALSSLSIDTGAEASDAVKTVQELKIKTTADVERARTCDQNRAAVFLAARDSDPLKSGPAILKLKAALKNNLDLIPDKSAADIDGLDLAGLENMYKDVGRRFLNAPERMQKLCDALR